MISPAEALITRLSEVEKIKIRLAASDDAVIGLYHRFKHELPGGHLLGGTEAEGIEAMREVAALLNAEFTERSKAPGFPRGWAF